MDTKSSELYTFVKSLFEGQGKELIDGAVRIEMSGDPRFLIVRLYENKEKNTVEVSINGDSMGFFRKYSGQGLKYEFIQRNRKGIRKGRTVAEQYMENTCICHNDEVRLQKVYH